MARDTTDKNAAAAVPTNLATMRQTGLVWTADLIFEYLENPRTFLRAYLDDSTARAKMSF